MEALSNEKYKQHTALIVFLWLLAMLIGGLVLIRYGDVLQSAFA